LSPTQKQLLRPVILSLRPLIQPMRMPVLSVRTAIQPLRLPEQPLRMPVQPVRLVNQLVRKAVQSVRGDVLPMRAAAMGLCPAIIWNTYHFLNKDQTIKPLSVFIPIPAHKKSPQLRGLCIDIDGSS
jgi:hypothetical protein